MSIPRLTNIDQSQTVSSSAVINELAAFAATEAASSPKNVFNQWLQEQANEAMQQQASGVDVCWWVANVARSSENQQEELAVMQIAVASALPQETTVDVPAQRAPIEGVSFNFPQQGDSLEQQEAEESSWCCCIRW